jgi:hypothetical protein
MGHKHWSVEETEKLTELYPENSIYKLVEIFSRSKIALKSKASKLGLKADLRYHRPKKWGDLGFNPYEKLTEPERAYIAGILDGEGNINFCHINYRTEMGMRARIIIWNTNKELIEWLQSKVPGTVQCRTPRKSTHNNCFAWTLHGIIKVRHLLNVLLPYLIVKKEQAQAVVAYRSKFD